MPFPLLQVELNTIAASFACLSSLTTRMHRYTLARHAGADRDVRNLPDNAGIDALPAAIATAAAAYMRDPRAVVVMVVQPNERNAYDQQWIQQALWSRHGLRTLRRTLAQVETEGVLHPDGSLTLGAAGPPVSVFYFRAGYGPDDYPSEAEWAGRAKIERSSAVKCPTVAYQLAGAKKVQQDLAAPGVLERFVPSAPEAARLRAFFAGLWSLDAPQEPATAGVIAQALADPDSFVLKPQREGGGNNLYGAALRETLAAGQGLSAYILMQRIKPPINKSILVRAGSHVEADTLSELGIYGCFVRQGAGRVLLNQEAGHLVRTKTATSNEGGVAAGFAVLDSPYLTDD